MHDPRGMDRIRHQVGDLLCQRVYGLACGHEDLSDHDVLRNDLA
ncbi:transposase [Methylobacter sp. BBA5.1]